MAVTNDKTPVFQELPNELLKSVFDLLPNRDIKNLRLTCRYLSHHAPLRLDRVFISANPLNIEVFLAVANHNSFRHKVKEIIWDDATFKSLGSSGNDLDFNYSSDEDETDDNDYQGSSRFQQLCREAIEDAESRLNHYTQLLKGQNDIFESGADKQAFQYALQASRFPNLTKVTVTPAVHGFLFFPLYETPMIRAFPYGFIYPIPRGWTCAGNVDVPQRAEPWEEDKQRKWRGVQIVLELLADPQVAHNISELSFDNYKLLTGFNHRVFDQPNEEYNNLCRILERPGFKSITLSVLTGWLSGQDVEDWNFLKKGKIRSALAKAHDLEEITFQTDYPVDETCWAGPAEDTISLFDIFPLSQRLKHFGLSGIQVTQEKLISVLARLQHTLQSIELSFLSVIKGTGNYAGILANIRDTLGWRYRPVDQRIRVRILVRVNQDAARYICLDKEVNDYVYGDGPPPFGVNRGGYSYAMITAGTGMQYDEFDADFARQHR
ncbi:hypothetical protein FAUST_10942 [Fusarium austroamericanum]|uniref:F-box domain-containing protein n=1 Tax=Fusarium austroamericanum TaxID=282268 RepID=A0AAN6BVK2_FUSAU|nr:hypothetical protein FAUST_10942 [Fusarium austroamericanum]